MDAAERLFRRKRKKMYSYIYDPLTAGFDKNTAHPPVFSSRVSARCLLSLLARNSYHHNDIADAGMGVR